MLAAVAGLLPTAAMLALLAARDPKRLRNLPHGVVSMHEPLAVGARRALAALSVIPGIMLASLGLWDDLLIWLGLSGTCGWSAALYLARST